MVANNTYIRTLKLSAPFLILFSFLQPFVLEHWQCERGPLLEKQKNTREQRKENLKVITKYRDCATGIQSYLLSVYTISFRAEEGTIY